MVRFLLPKGTPGPYGRLIRASLIVVELIVVFFATIMIAGPFLPTFHLPR